MLSLEDTYNNITNMPSILVAIVTIKDGRIKSKSMLLKFYSLVLFPAQSKFGTWFKLII